MLEFLSLANRLPLHNITAINLPYLDFCYS